VRDFAYESACWSPTPRPQKELDTGNHDPASPLSVEKGNISGDQAIIVPHSPTYPKRRREDDEERAAHIEGLPSGKRPKPDNSQFPIMRNCDPSSPLSVEKGNISGDRAIILSHSPTHMKRHRKDNEKAEGLPSGKRPRLDDSSSEGCGLAVIAVTEIRSGSYD
jgi:hypothetical protein